MPETSHPVDPLAVRHETTTVDGLRIFYREAGDRRHPTLVLLHGFPPSSVMFRDLMPRLADRLHLLAPDFPGFGKTTAPRASHRDRRAMSILLAGRAMVG